MEGLDEETHAERARKKQKKSAKQGDAPGASRRKGGDGGDANADGDEELSETKKLLPSMTVELRDYQLKGVRWLVALYQNGLNGILADQMGLGKTVQTIGFLSHLRNKGILGPYLILGPLSTLSNWINEFNRFCPEFPAVLYHGSKQERAEIRSKRLPTSQPITHDFPVIVTSFEIVMADRKFLQKYNFKYLVVDEGHRLKNFDCKLIRELKFIPTANKLLLTGTPLQNSLPELWSLLHFLLPDVFTSLSQFQGWFDFEDKEDASNEDASKRVKVVEKLHGILKPFLLRRLKGDVETNLPRKKEIVLYAHMVETQRKFNDALVDKTIGDMLQKISGGTAPIGATALNNMLMQLRKNCNHPDLITGGLDGSIMFPSADELVEQCGKFRLLDRLMTRLRAKGHKVLIFSQMTRMLDLIESFFEQRGNFKVCRIDGSVQWQDRKTQMDLFNTDPEYGVFLLSTRAGGLGINLTAADTVIIYDSDWNPHQDMQAMDRCHRIGQTKPVHVLRLATAHSVEGKMLSRANSKLALEKLVITKGNFRQEIGKEADATLKGGRKKASGGGVSTDELVALLRGDVDDKDGVPQSADISDADLETIMCRDDLLGKAKPNPRSGPGWEEVEDRSGMSLLGNVNKE